MPETPDFDQKALNILDSLPVFSSDLSDVQTKALAQNVIAEQLRLIWNARGAADITKLESELSSLWASPPPAPR